MKKRLTVATIMLLIFVLSILCYGCSYSLIEEGTQAKTEREILDGYYAKICYHNYTLYGTGHSQAFSLIYDYSFYQKQKSVLVDILNDIKTSFESYGYSVSIDTFSGSLFAEMVFETTEDFYKAIGYDGFAIEKNNADKIERSAFYVKYTYRSKTVFEDINKDYKIVGRLLYFKGCRDAGIPQKKVLLDYIYGTPYNENTIHSDCDKVTYVPESKLYLHEFYMTLDTADRTIELTQRTPNTTTWFAISIVAGVVVFSIPFIIMICKRKRSK